MYVEYLALILFLDIQVNYTMKRSYFGCVFKERHLFEEHFYLIGKFNVGISIEFYFAIFSFDEDSNQTELRRIVESLVDVIS